MALRNRKTLRVALIFLVAILLVPLFIAAGIYLAAHFKYSRQVEEELSRAGASGRPFRWAELSGIAGERIPQGGSAWEKVLLLLKYQGSSEDDAMFRFITANGNVEESDRGTLLSILDQNGLMFEAAAAACQAPPIPPAYFRHGNPVGFLRMEVPEPSRSLRDYTYFARVAFLRATLRPETAVETCQMLMALADTLDNDPFAASQFTRARVYDFALWPVIQQMLRAGRTEEAKRLVGGRLLSLDVRSWILLALKGERAIGIEFFEGFTLGKRDVLSILESPDLGTRMGCFASYPGIPWIQRDYAAYLSLEREKQESLGSPYSEWLGRVRQLVRNARRESWPLFNVMAGNPAYETLCEADANVRIAKMALGIDEEGVFDPFVGQPLHVRQEGKLRVIWSVGRNGKDDGGSKDDIVWRVP